jgi:hypothetical protein
VILLVYLFSFSLDTKVQLQDYQTFMVAVSFVWIIDTRTNNHLMLYLNL